MFHFGVAHCGRGLVGEGVEEGRRKMFRFGAVQYGGGTYTNGGMRPRCDGDFFVSLLRERRGAVSPLSRRARVERTRSSVVFFSSIWRRRAISSSRMAGRAAVRC